MDGMPELFPDKVHPNEEGAKVMAKAVYQALKEWNREVAFDIHPIEFTSEEDLFNRMFLVYR